MNVNYKKNFSENEKQSLIHLKNKKAVFKAYLK